MMPSPYSVWQGRPTIRSRIAEAASLPSSVRLTVVYDLAEFVRNAVASVRDAIAIGGLLSLVWPPVQHLINLFSDFASKGNPGLAVFLYGVVERLMLPFGLHHVWNVPFFFQVGTFTTPSGVRHAPSA